MNTSITYPNVNFQPLLDRIRKYSYKEGWAETFLGRSERVGTERYKKALVTYAQAIERGCTAHTALIEALEIPRPPMPGEHVHWTAVDGSKSHDSFDEQLAAVLSSEQEEQE